MLDMVEVTAAVLPEDRPRYLMGVGTPEDLLAAIARGIDMFDCVMPTRSGRHCQAFTWGGRLNLRNARYAEDPTPLDAESACPAAQYARAYLHHLVRSGEVLGAMLLSLRQCAVLSGADGARAGGDRPRRIRRLRRRRQAPLRRHDETDALVVFDDVLVPWDRVFVDRDIAGVRRQFFDTGAHVLGNWQAQIRFVAKLQFIAGVARRVAHVNGVDTDSRRCRRSSASWRRWLSGWSRPCWPPSTPPNRTRRASG